MLAKTRALILAAGFGTRMGEIGKILPKVMWPLFEVSLLEAQVKFAKMLGIKKIYINLHHQRELILAAVKNRPEFESVVWLIEEPDILDIGGAVHNLASRPELNYSGEVLILNADQFFYFDSEQLKSWIHQVKKQKASGFLLLQKVNRGQGYNKVVLDDAGFFDSIRSLSELTPEELIYSTYTGTSWIDLRSLERSSGVSKFFQTVVKKGSVKYLGIELTQEHEYWDFGTAERYLKTIQKIIHLLSQSIPSSPSTSPFLNFLLSSQILDGYKINKKALSYNADLPRVMNFSNTRVDTFSQNMTLLGPATAFKEGHFCYQDKCQPYPSLSG